MVAYTVCIIPSVVLSLNLKKSTVHRFTLTAPYRKYCIISVAIAFYSLMKASLDK